VGRISGVDIPRDKRAVIALTYVYGIGSLPPLRFWSKLRSMKILA